jgi:hypothetical protein
MKKINASLNAVVLTSVTDSTDINKEHRGYSSPAAGIKPPDGTTVSVRNLKNEIPEACAGGRASEERVREKNHVRRLVYFLGSVAAVLSILWGCATIPRLDDKFDVDALGSPPSTSPSPTPPNDSLSFTVFQQVDSAVVADPAGGRRLRITPTPAFISSPNLRKRAVIITSDSLTTSPPAQIRGHLRLQVDGTGVVIVGFLPIQGAQSPDFISGIQVSSFALPEGLRGEAYVLYGFAPARIEDPFQLNVSGKIADYQPGTPTDIFWSIDQASRTFSASASGGTSQSATFPAASAGVATTPIQQLSLWVWLQNPSAGTAVFIDNLYAEEYR